MALNAIFAILYLSISFPLMVLSNNPVMNILSKQLLDKSPVIPLAKLLMTAKLAKDLQQKNAKLNGADKTRYLFFVGKGNIQFQNHELEVVNSTEPIDSETTTNFYDDLSKNKPLMKFVARNGHEVWERMLVLPKNFENETHPTNETKSKATKPEKSDKIKVKPLYKPDVQLIEGESGIIEHKIESPQWVENRQKTNNKLVPIYDNNQKPLDFYLMPDKESPRSIKSKDKKNVLNKRKATIKQSKSFFGFNTRIGRVVIEGFNRIIRGISSLLGQKRRKYN